jgi:phosphohistidine phosphatase SixA
MNNFNEVLKRYYGLKVFHSNQSLDFKKLTPSARCKVKYITLLQGNPKVVEGNGAVLTEGYNPKSATIKMLVIENGKEDVSFYKSGAVVLTLGNSSRSDKIQKSSTMEFLIEDFNKTWTAELM